MKKFLVAMGLVAFAVVGCDDSSSASAGQNDEPAVESSSSSVTQQSSSSVRSSSSAPVEDLSSSSEKAKSSSSDTQSDAKQSSSSEKSGKSSSSVNDVSSNSLNDFDWNLPKEAYLNPDIDYGTMTDERDGKVYKTVEIGEQVWMAQNLNYADSTNTPSLNGKSWCYNNEPKNCDVTGRLYTWAAAIDSVKLATDADYPQNCGYDNLCALGIVQGICPNGWHLPDKDEWNALFTELRDEFAVGTKLKSQSGWYNDGSGADAFGFSALPAGLYYRSTFSNDGNMANFWSSSHRLETAYGVLLHYNSDRGYLDEVGNYKDMGYSIRCVKD